MRGGEVKHTALYHVLCREARRRCWSPPPKYTRLWCALGGLERHIVLLRESTSHDTSQLNRVRHQSQQPTPLPPSFCLVPLAPFKFRAERTKKSPPSKPCTHTDKGIHPPLPKTPTTRPSPPHRHLKTSTRQHQAESSSCLLPPAPRVSPSRVLPPPSISVIPLPSAPASQPRASPSLDRSWASIASSALCRRQHPCCSTHLRRRRPPAGPPSLPPPPERHRLPAGTRNRRSGSVSLFFSRGRGVDL